MKKKQIVPVQQQTITVKPRKCGTPKLGGTYITIGDDQSGFSKFPIWKFMIDVTFPIPEDWDLCNQGMQLRPRTNLDGSYVVNAQGKIIYDLWDVIGQDYEIPDWMYEVQYQGFHQLISKNTEYDKFTKEMNYYGCNKRGYIMNPWDYYEQRQKSPFVDWPDCPKNEPVHLDGQVMTQTCAGLLIQTLKKGTGTPISKGSRTVKVTLPGGDEYYGYTEIPGNEYGMAAFIKLPIGIMMDIRIYEDPNEHKEVDALKKLDALEESLKRVKIVPFN